MAEFDQETAERRALRVLRMVHELHKLGYQGLRIEPALAPSGGAWRCAVSHVENVRRDRGARFVDDARDVARYTTGQDNTYFGWKDASGDSVKRLAQRFLERFPEICEKARLRDWEYAGWYVEMLGFAERGEMPVALADWGGSEPDPRFIETLGSRHGLCLPAPPLGKAEHRS